MMALQTPLLLELELPWQIEDNFLSKNDTTRAIQPITTYSTNSPSSTTTTTKLTNPPTTIVIPTPIKNAPTNRMINVTKIQELHFYWNYHWGMKKHSHQPSDVQFIPMMWNGKSSNERLIETLQQQDMIDSYVNGTITRLLGFNEPDFVAQANMTVSEAVERWFAVQTYLQEEPYNVPLVSPSCAHPKGEWMQEFMRMVQEKCLRIDSIGVHWYGPANFTIFQKEMEQYYTMYGSQYPLSITEFAPADWTATSFEGNRYNRTVVLDFMKQALPWLEQTSWITSYAWFSFPQDNPVGWTSALFQTIDTNNNNNTNNNSHSSNSSLVELTTLGRYYQSVRNDNIYGDVSIQFM